MSGPFDIEIIERDDIPEGEALIISPPLMERDAEDPGVWRLNPHRVAKIKLAAEEAS